VLIRYDLQFFLRMAVSFVAIVIALPNVLRASEADIARVRSQYPSALARLERHYSQTVASGTLVSRNGAHVLSQKVRIEIDGNLKKATLVKEADGLNSAREVVQCVGLSGPFTVRRQAVGVPYVLTGMGAGPADATWLFDHFAGRYLLSSITMLGVPLSETMVNPKFRVTSAQSDRSHDEETMTFNYSSVDASGNPITGKIEALPGKGWVIRRHESLMKAIPFGVKGASGSDLNVIMEAEYSGDDDGIPVPRLVKFNGAEKTRSSEFRFDKVEYGVKTPVREFAMTYYGLPDIAVTGRDQSRDYWTTTYWLFGGATVAMVGSVILKRRQSAPR
jgi:hypothetical protein